MASIEAEYHRFMTYLAQREVSDDVRRLARLVLTHLPPLAEVGAARRARSARLAPLAVEQFAQMPAAYDGQANAANPGPVLGRLHQLDVGPFRGFTRRETFDLSHDITLVYGANGTGKSSFFEALEVAMLGSISEAQVKRVDQRAYCNNARLRRHVPPTLTATVAGQPLPVVPDEDQFRFCFIEKNRLDDFARIAARTPADQRQLIATLFGVDQFSEFVRGFNPALDQDLMLFGPCATQLAHRRMQLAASEQTIAAHAHKIAAVEAMEQALAHRMFPNTLYQDCVKWLIGTAERAGQLAYVQGQLDAPLPTIYDVTPAKLQWLLAEVYRLNGLWQASREALANRAAEVSYAKLYEAVLALANGADACPACGTNLAAVAQDPFVKARAGLEQLAQLAALQREEVNLRSQNNEAIRALWEEMRRVIQIVTAVFPAHLQEKMLPALPPNFEGNWLGKWVDVEQPVWPRLLEIAALVEAADVQAREAHAQRASLVKQRDQLYEFRSEIERLSTLRSAAEQEVAAARQTVGMFDEENRDLVQQVQNEIPVVAQHHRIKAAYDAFLPEIQGYLAALPGVLLQGLGDQARDLYNSFNRSDAAGDLLHALRLPLAENGKIEVEFAGEPGVRYDALVIFSEGHIKCLGLAILLAKNIAQGCPVVIFDDVVNAIDDDHRDGIWRTFFEDGHLDRKQVILTSHAEEFLHRIQQELGIRRAGAIKRYKFLPHEAGHELRVDGDPPTKNYVLLAQEALAGDEKREALRQARPALESLTDRLWTWLGRRGAGGIEIKLDGPRSKWELNNKCMKLRSAINRNAGLHQAVPAAAAALDRILGLNGATIEWRCLNSGVHDAQQDHEFDRAAVRTVVESVVALDAALDALQNR